MYRVAHHQGFNMIPLKYNSIWFNGLLITYFYNTGTQRCKAQQVPLLILTAKKTPKHLDWVVFIIPS